MPKGMPRRLDASWATSCPTRVILNAVFLMVSHSTSKFSPLACSRATFTTPGPLTPTLMMASASVTPWNAPAIKGLSSGALQNTTSLAQPKESCSLVARAVSFIICPIKFTASILRPVLVEPTLTELHTRSVTARAFGMDRIRFWSALVMPLLTRAEYPPRKLTPTSFAARSRVWAMVTKSSGVWQAHPPTRAMGVTEILLFTMGMPKSRDMASPVLTRSLAVVAILW